MLCYTLPSEFLEKKMRGKKGYILLHCFPPPSWRVQLTSALLLRFAKEMMQRHIDKS